MRVQKLFLTFKVSISLLLYTFKRWIFLTPPFTIGVHLREIRVLLEKFWEPLLVSVYGGIGKRKLNTCLHMVQFSLLTVIYF